MADRNHMTRQRDYISGTCQTFPHFWLHQPTVHMAETYFLHTQEVTSTNGGVYDYGDIASATQTGHLVRDDQEAGRTGSQPQGQPNQSASSTPDMAGPDGQVRLPNKFAWNPSSNGLIVDVEGFQMKKDFYVKEMAFVNPQSKAYWVGTFLPPYSRQAMKKRYIQDMDWAMRNLHGLKWEEGLYPYNVAFTMLNHFGNNSQLLAKGREKCLWIQQHTSLPVIDLEELGCPPAKDLPFGSFCVFHNSLHKSCALDKAAKLGQYVMDLFSLKSVAPVVLEFKSAEKMQDTDITLT